MAGITGKILGMRESQTDLERVPVAYGAALQLFMRKPSKQSSGPHVRGTCTPRTLFRGFFWMCLGVLFSASTVPAILLQQSP